MDELIKSVQQTPKVPGALKKHEQEQERKKQANVKEKNTSKKDPKRIIDTYA